MAGTKTQAFLQNGNYDTFFKLAHDLSEVILSDLIAIKTVATIITKVSTIEEQEQAKQSATALMILAQDAVDAIRDYYYPQIGIQTHHEINRVRWSPYDAGAWDTFYNNLCQILTKHLEAIRNTYTDLEQYPIESKAKEFLIKVRLENYARLQKLLSSGGFEEVIFRKGQT